MLQLKLNQDWGHAPPPVVGGHVVLLSTLMIYILNTLRFGFVTFATNEDVKRVLSQGVIFFRGKQVNVGPAVKRLVNSTLFSSFELFNNQVPWTLKFPS